MLRNWEFQQESIFPFNELDKSDESESVLSSFVVARSLAIIVISIYRFNRLRCTWSFELKERNLLRTDVQCFGFRIRIWFMICIRNRWDKGVGKSYTTLTVELRGDPTKSPGVILHWTTVTLWNRRKVWIVKLCAYTLLFSWHICGDYSLYVCRFVLESAARDMKMKIAVVKIF